MQDMHINLPPGLEEFVQSRIAERGYSSVSEYVSELIRADQEQSAKRLLEEQVLTGIRSGESLPMTARDWEEIRGEVRARYDAREAR
ncbi:MAG: type II toxin-antitoxin system ParD family antitoxin [Planctomycetes bacterium]|nr:type II toxin-antitoxin system ParD family antitoxin [Planctomycetota bacterium]